MIMIENKRYICQNNNKKIKNKEFICYYKKYLFWIYQFSDYIFTMFLIKKSMISIQNTKITSAHATNSKGINCFTFVSGKTCIMWKDNVKILRNKKFHAIWKRKCVFVSSIFCTPFHHYFLTQLNVFYYIYEKNLCKHEQRKKHVLHSYCDCEQMFYVKR